MAERVHSQDIYIHESVDFEIARRWMWINCKNVDSISVDHKQTNKNYKKDSHSNRPFSHIQ